VCEYAIFPIIGAVVIFFLILIKGLYTEKQKIMNAPVTDQFIPTVSKQDDKTSVRNRTKKRKLPKLPESSVNDVFFFALFASPIAWVVGQLGFLLMYEIGWDVCVSDPWYGDNSVLLVIIAILGFQVFRYVRKSFK